MGLLACKGANAKPAHAGETFDDNGRVASLDGFNVDGV